jgi:hypothetical protein
MFTIKEKERICREIGSKEVLANSLWTRAEILSEVMHRPREALAVAQEAYRIVTELEQVDLIKGVQELLDQLCYEETMEMAFLERQVEDWGEIKDSLISQALEMRDAGEKQKALALLKEREQIARKLEDTAGLAISLANQGELLAIMDEPEAGIPLVQEALQLVKRLDLPKLAILIEGSLEKVQQAVTTLEKQRVKYSDSGKLICPICKLESDKGASICKWCKMPLKGR